MHSPSLHKNPPQSIKNTFKLFENFRTPHTHQNEYYTFGLFEGTNETGIQVRVSSTDSGTKVFTFFMEYRYVIIKSSQSISARQKSEYAKMSFNEIKEKFNIY